ncbi:hypothetical protein BFJ63_vAg12903 [Fusarium oxysporum f. sp. narcissi]|uniref:Uncharacterized protein n=1 Tax=Fusarium oxysporum f. sp. narcissi TaxID=451672 RepID=A0A4Q2VHK1_FUSOX|nr:hypothetical protein BFJ63_vAg12903 [Fusarium oxysporum f. sp. narcissi]
MSGTTTLSIQSFMPRKRNNGKYKDCFGDEYHTIQRRPLRNIILWRVVGDLTSKAENIRRSLSNLIDELLVHPQADTLLPNLPPYAIHCLLIGVSKLHAAPFVTIVTSVAWLSIRLKTIITNAKFLKAFPDWHCFRLPINPEVTAPNHLQVSIPTSHCSSSAGDYRVFVPDSALPTGAKAIKVEIWKDSSYVGEATVGGMIVVGGEEFAVTVAHVIYPQQPCSPNTFEIDESELNFLAGYETSDDAQYANSLGDLTLDSSPSTPQAEPSFNLSPSLIPQDSDGYSGVNTDLHKPKTLIGYLAFVSCSGSEKRGSFGALDWALIKLDPGISKANQFMSVLPRNISRLNDSGNAVKGITILTASATISGAVISEALFGIPGFKAPQPVRVVDTGNIQKGDSGSMVVQKGTELPIGILIGVCRPLNESYILTIEDLLQDIKAQIGEAAMPIYREASKHIRSLDLVFRARMAATIIDLISTTITTLEAATGHYSVVKGDKGLPEAFHEASRGLLLVGWALQTAKTQLGGRDLAGDPQSAMDSLKECNTNAELSKNIFNAVAQAPETLRFECYKEAVRQEGKGRTMEVLVIGMMNNVYVLAKNNAIRAGLEDQVHALRGAIEQLSKMEPSVPKEGSDNTYNHYSSGDQFNAPEGTQNITKGNGPQFPGGNFHAPLSFGSGGL